MRLLFLSVETRFLQGTRHELVKLVVERAYVKDDELVAMTLEGVQNIV